MLFSYCPRAIAKNSLNAVLESLLKVSLKHLKWFRNGFQMVSKSSTHTHTHQHTMQENQKKRLALSLTCSLEIVDLQKLLHNFNYQAFFICESVFFRYAISLLLRTKLHLFWIFFRVEFFFVHPVQAVFPNPDLSGLRVNSTMSGKSPQREQKISEF